MQEMPEEDEPDLQLRSRAGYGGARSRVTQPDQSTESGVADNGAHQQVVREEADVADSNNGEDQQVVREEEVGSNFIDRDKLVLVGLACIVFNVV